MSAVPWIDWATATRLAGSVVPAGPPFDAEQVNAAVAELRSSAERAPELVQAASKLPEIGQAQHLMVDRRGLLAANVASARGLLGFPEEPDGLADAARGRALALGLGVTLGVVASRVLGQFDPFGPRPRLLLVVPTIMATERKLGVNPADFRMWVCLHEQTHRVQFASAPWLADHIRGLADEVVQADAEGGGALLGSIEERLTRLREDRANQRATSAILFDMLNSPRMVEALDRVVAVMSLLEGHAEVMMDRAAPGVIDTLPQIRARFEARRGKDGVSSVLGWLIGLDAKLEQYRNGAKFCKEVIRRRGVIGLNRAFEAPEQLPTLPEILEPKLWIKRIES